MTTFQMLNKSTQRFYSIRIYQDLLGDWNLRREYGGLSNKKHNTLSSIYTSEYHAKIDMMKIIKVRIKRGYVANVAR